MSYYRPSFSHTSSMVRGRGGFSSSRGYRGSSPRGSSSRGSSSWNDGGGRGSYSRGGKFSSSFSGGSYDRSYDSRSKYGSSDRFSSSSRGHSDEYHKPYRQESYSSRDSHRSPERKRPRTEAPSSRHESSLGSSYHSSSYPDSRRSYSGERHASTPYASSKREEFRRPSGPPPSSRGSYRGRLSSRGSGGPRGLRMRDRLPTRRMIGSSYAVRKRMLPPRSSEFGRRIMRSRIRSTITRRGGPRRRIDRDEESSEEEKEEDEDEEEEEEEETEKPAVKKEKKEESDTKGEDSKQDEEKPKSAAVKKEKDPSTTVSKKDPEAKSPVRPKNFIKLECPHCNLKVQTFRKYELHLESRSHLIAMRKVAIKQRSILAQMRQAQRNTQNELEKTTSTDDLTNKTNFCPLCKLNYKQRKSVHQVTEAHKNMRKFLMPYCKVCNITFKSPMIYESHCCSVEHLKRKQRVENDSDGSGEEDNLEDFTTIDSVGDVEETGSDAEKKEKVKKEPVNVGIEQIRKVEAHYCDLCKMYLPRGNEEDMPPILAKHCKLRVHMQRYVRFKENQELEKRAEKLQRKEMAEKEKKKEEVVKEKVEKKETTIKKDEEVKETEVANKSVNNEDDKLWADVDKDLGEILAEADGAKSSDEDEEDDSHVNGERYDRFKLSEEKNEKDEKKSEETEKTEEKPSSEAMEVEETK